MFRLVLFVLLGLATFKLASAEQQQEQQTVTQLPIMINCIPNESFFKLLEDYGEEPFSQGDGSWSIPGNRDINGLILTYVNPKTFTFTIAIDFDTVKCVVISGRTFSPMGRKNLT